MVVVEWDPPSDNNSAIIRYNVYLSSRRIRVNEISDQPTTTTTSGKEKFELRKVAVIPAEKKENFYEFLSLDLATCYYVVVTAESQHGEGYKAEPLMVRTLAEDLDAGAGNLYVWGNNANSELGLSDEHVMQNVTSYSKFAMKKPIRQTAFQEESVVQVAAGNASSVFLVIDPETRYQTIVYSGLTTITKDEKCQK